jgi:glutaredoxin
MPHLVFYTRKDCHLCEVALGALRPLQTRYGFSLQVVDLDTAAPDKLAAYDEQVPVVELDGRKIMKYRIDTARLQRLLDIG